MLDELDGHRQRQAPTFPFVVPFGCRTRPSSSSNTWWRTRSTRPSSTSCTRRWIGAGRSRRNPRVSTRLAAVQFSIGGLAARSGRSGKDRGCTAL